MGNSMRRLLVGLLAAGAALGTDGARAASEDAAPPVLNQMTFLPSDAEFPNPERGFYRALPTDLAQLSVADVNKAFAAGHRLVYARIDLEPYRDTDLPQALIKKLDAAFGATRRAGIKLIVRATYNYPRGETQYRDAQDASLPRVLGHIAQLAPMLRRNADVIAYVQAGLIGAWGEWHASSNGLTEPGPRTQIKDALLDAIPPDRFVQFRYPPYISAWVPLLPGARRGGNGFRIGFHNDCFLASATDVGTYSDDPKKRRVERQYLDQLGDIAPFGGETCNPADDPGAVPRTGCNAVLAEGARYNLTYLNEGYYRKLFHERWTAQGCMAEVRRRMGYRVALVAASHPETASRGAQVHRLGADLQPAHDRGDSAPPRVRRDAALPGHRR